jgi:hypothetical protein
MCTTLLVVGLLRDPREGVCFLAWCHCCGRSCLFAHEVTSSGTGARSMLLGLLSLHDVAASGSIIVYSIPFSISNQKELPVHLELVY